MDNVERLPAGDSFYPTTRVLTADGVVNPVGCLDGQPVHQRRVHRASRMEVDGRAPGLLGGDRLMVIVLAWFRDHCARVVAHSRRRDLADPALHRHADRRAGVPGIAKSHAPAVVLALTPHLAAWGKLMIDNALGAAGTSAAAVGLDKLAQVGVLYQGLAIMGGGAIIGGLVLGAIAAFIIDGAMRKAAAFAFAGAVLTFFGFMHGEAIGIAQSPMVAELSHRGGGAARVREVDGLVRPMAAPAAHAAGD